MHKLFLAAAVALLPLAAHASIIITATGGGTGNNILFEAPETGTSIMGDFKAGTFTVPVTFKSISNLNTANGPPITNQTIQTLTQTAQGQADIMCSAACINGSPPPGASSQLNSLQINIGGGFAVTEFIGDLNFGEGVFTINAFDQMGNVFSYTLGNGANFFDAVAQPGSGEVITEIQITDNGTMTPAGWNDFKQPRVNGACVLVGTTCTVIATPEPGSLMMLTTWLGFLTAMSYLIWRRRRTDS